MDQILNTLNLWLSENQHLILIFIAALAFLESLAVIGLIVPGVALLMVASAAAGSSDIPLSSVLMYATAGAIAGDGISFLLGYHYHQYLYKAPILKDHPKWIHKSEQFIRQYGLIGVVLGRFIGPARPFMPVIAGAMQMRPISFFSVNIASAIAWAPFYLLPGYLIGANLDNEKALGAPHLAFLFYVLLFAWLTAQIAWWLYQHIHTRRKKTALSLAVAFNFLALFFMVSQVMQLDIIVQANQTFTLWMASLRHSWLDTFFIPLTTLGNPPAMILWATLITISILIQRNWYAATLWVGSTLIAYGLLVCLKSIFEWPRPSIIHQPPESTAYPSGHTTMTFIFLALLLILCLPGIQLKKQKAAISSIFIIAFFMATSRLYLTVHWATDIIGGLLLSGFLLSVLYFIVLKKPFHRVKPIPVIFASIISWLISYSYWVHPHLPHLKQIYSSTLQ